MGTIEEIARVCHEANRAYCATIGDLSQPSWEDAPQWQKDSAIVGVQTALDDQGRTPRDSHVGWMAHKLAEGWRCGPKKDPERKEHPYMVPYEELPPEQRVKDHLFLAVVRAMSRS